MEAKYHMTREENIFVAKRNIVDYIWKSARLEGLAVTYCVTGVSTSRDIRRMILLNPETE